MAEALAAAFTDKLLTCSICLGEYEDPRVLPCYHTFCYGCICDHATRTMTPKRTFLCPLCREEIEFPREGLVKLKKDFRIHTTKELLSQQQQTAVSSTIKTDVQEVTLTTKCEKHPTNELKYYCEDDDTVVCGDCALTEHYRHGIVPVEKAAISNRKKIKTVLVKTVSKLNMFKEAVTKETASDIEESWIRAASINKIKEQAKRIRKLVDQKEQELISEVNSAYDIRKKQKEANKDTLELHHASLQSVCNFAQELITNGSDSEIMIHTKALTERLTVMEKMPVQTPDTPAQVSYSPGKISTARLEAMLGQVTVQSQPPLAGQGTNPTSVTHSPIFLEKAECVHSFYSKLKDDRLMFVLGLVIDEQHMFIVDKSNNRTKVFTHEGKFKFDIKLNQPVDVAVSQTGHLYITSHVEKCVKVYSTRGQHLTNMGCCRLEMPNGVTLNTQGHVMVCDRSRRSIFTFHAESGQLRKTIPLRMRIDPMYITVNSVNDNIVISDLYKHCVHVLSPTGDHLYQYGSRKGSELSLPHGVCTDSYGHIFIADRDNHRIVALSPQGQFIRYIATKDDGLKSPTAVAINPAGQLVVTEERGLVKTFKYLP